MWPEDDEGERERESVNRSEMKNIHFAVPFKTLIELFLFFYY